MKDYDAIGARVAALLRERDEYSLRVAEMFSLMRQKLERAGGRAVTWLQVGKDGKCFRAYRAAVEFALYQETFTMGLPESPSEPGDAVGDELFEDNVRWTEMACEVRQRQDEILALVKEER